LQYDAAAMGGLLRNLGAVLAVVSFAEAVVERPMFAKDGKLEHGGTFRTTWRPPGPSLAPDLENLGTLA
jgi:hypothetical protein